MKFTLMNNSNEIVDEYILDKILTMESEQMLIDIFPAPELFVQLFSMTEEEKIIYTSFIKKILKRLHYSGSLKIILSFNHEDVLGYGLIFKPNEIEVAYMHKLFVFKKHRNNGIGSEILKLANNSFDKLSLICNQEKIPFFEKNGFINNGYVTPNNEDRFSITRMMYYGAAIMFNNKKVNICPIFLLTNEDIYNMIKQKEILV